MQAPFPVHFHVDPRRGWPGVVVGGLAGAAGLWLALGMHEAREGFVAAGFGGFLMAWLGQPLWRRVPRLTVDGLGLHVPLPGFGTVPWADVEVVRLATVARRSFLVVDRVEAARRAAPPTVLARTFARAAGAADLALPLDGLTRAPADVAAAVELARELAACAR